MSTKKISIVLPTLGGGGAERVSLTLASEFIARGFAVDIVLMSLEGELLDCVPNGVRIIDLRSPRIRGVPLTFLHYLRQESPDVVVANMWPLTTVCIIACSVARSKARLIVCEHVTLSHAYQNLGWVHGLLLRTSLSVFHLFADIRVTVSKGVASDLSNLTGMRNSKFNVVYNPIVVSLPNASAVADVAAIWHGWSGKRVISVGTLKRQKNHALLIHAFSQMVESVDARLMILGVGSLRGELESLTHQLGIAEKVLFPGFFPDPAPFYCSANLFVLSSDYEGFGNVIVEALACGLPVVSTNCPSGPAEILADGRYGQLVPVGDVDALARAMSEALTVDHDREALKRRAAEFSPARAADQYLALMFPDDATKVGGGRRLRSPLE